MRGHLIALAGSVLLPARGAGSLQQAQPQRASGATTMLRALLESADGLQAIVQGVYFAARPQLPPHYHP
jgi:quercetin dioxygenase-like cupin family protein